jgi:MerR family Zn(II)-responsive transcriptional regulator of zntA
MTVLTLRPTKMSDVCDLLGLTPRAIRYYEEQGLVEASRNRQNARCFDAAARVQLELIARLRRAGVSLKEIRSVLIAREEDADHAAGLIRAILEHRLCELENQAATVSQELEFVRSTDVGRARRLAR